MTMLVPVLLATVAVSLTGAIDYCGLFHENAVCVTTCPSGNIEFEQSYLCSSGICCKPPAGGVVTTPKPGTLIVDDNTCGVTGSSRRKRAITRVPGAQCYWPWLVSIRMGNSDFAISHVMTGVLDSNNTVLVHKNTFDLFAGVTTDMAIEAVVGDYDLNMNRDEQQVFIIDVTKSEDVEGDFLRLTLSKIVTVDGCVRPACLANEAESAQLDLTQCKLIGWGDMETGTGRMTLAPVPLQQDVTFLDQSTCDIVMKFDENSPAGANLCLDSEPIPNIPEGDRGNPIICPNANGQWYLKAMLVQGNYGPEGRSSSPPYAVDVVP